MLPNRLLAVARVPALAVPAPGRPRWTEARALVAALVRALRREQAPARTVQLALEANDAVTVLVRKLPLSVRCAAGSVWVTHPADPGDHVLVSGEEFRATGRGELVVVAFEPARVVVSGAILLRR